MRLRRTGSLDDRRTPIQANDIPDLLARWPGREESPKSFKVSVDQIRANSWQLLPSRYKPLRLEVTSHKSPVAILDEIIELESKIRQRVDSLKSALEPNDE